MSKRDKLIETRGIISGIIVRDINKEERKATFVAATEGGVETWYGIEYLNMDGIDTKRYKKNPVVLNAHNRWGVSDIYGEAAIGIEARQLVAEVRFAETQGANDAWQLTEGGFLRSISIGFMPRKVKVLKENESYTLGTREVTGPARIVEKWELLEISLVPVGADPDALKRGYSNGSPMEILDSLARALGCEIIKHKEPDMADKEKEADATNTESAILVAREQQSMEPTDKELLRRNVMAICPTGLEATAERCLLEGKDLEQTRQVLLKEHAEKIKPVGTVEQKPPDKTDGKPKERTLADVSDDELIRAF